MPRMLNRRPAFRNRISASSQTVESLRVIVAGAAKELHAGRVPQSLVAFGAPRIWSTLIGFLRPLNPQGALRSTLRAHSSHYAASSGPSIRFRLTASVRTNRFGRGIAMAAANGGPSPPPPAR